MHRFTSRLAAHAGTRQVDVSLYADAAADATDRAILAVWNKLLALFRGESNPWLAERYAAVIAGEFVHEAHRTISDSLERIAVWGHRTAAENVVKTLPLPWLAELVADRPAAKLHESRRLLEQQDADPSISGLIHLFLQGGKLDFADALGRLREPTANGIDASQARTLFQQLLFPAPPANVVRDIVNRLQVGNQTWQQRLRAGAVERFDPARIASTIGSSYAAGKAQRDIAKDLLPVVNGLKVNATRLARTYGLRVAGAMSQQVSDQLGDLRVGDQVHATLDQNTRPAHRARNGQVYYFHPKPGERPYSECPQPPLEADGSVAWNCRCHISPVLRPPARFHATNWKPFLNAEKDLIPDPAVYGQWFARADERRRKLAVGVKRYNAAKEALGRAPHYEELVEPDTGELVAVATLQQEDPADRAVRVQKVRREMDRREEAIRQVQTFGFVPPERVPGFKATATKPLASPTPAKPRPVEYTRTPWDSVRLKPKADAMPGKLKALASYASSRIRSAEKLAADLKPRIAEKFEEAHRFWDNSLTLQQNQARKAQLRAEGAALRDQVFRMILKPPSDAGAFVPVQFNAEPSLQSTANQAADLIRDILAHRERAFEFRANILPANRDGRAFYHGGAVYVQPDDVPTMLHELGHAIEEHYPEVGEAARAFLKHRVRDEPLRSIKRIFPASNYDANEMGREDDFGKVFNGANAYYVGKHYEHGATEIVSMGLQALYVDPIGFARKDPEYYRFMLGVLHGKI